MNRRKKTVREVADEMQAIKTSRGASERSIGDMQWRLTKIADAFAVNIGRVTTGDVQKWLDGMTGSPRSVLNFRRITGTLFAFAESRGYIAKGENPVTGTFPAFSTATTKAQRIIRPSSFNFANLYDAQ